MLTCVDLLVRQRRKRVDRPRRGRCEKSGVEYDSLSIHGLGLNEDEYITNHPMLLI